MDAEFISQAIEAILSQSYRDFELIIINDASKDNTDQIVRKYALQDKRIKYIRNRENCGVVKTSNLGCRHATGKYLYCASSDDWIKPCFFETAIDNLEKHKASLCFLETTFLYENGEYRPHKAIENVNELTYYDPERALQVLKNSYVSTASAIVKLDSFIKQGYYSEKMAVYCDIISLNFIAGTEGFVYVPKEGTICRLYREHETKYNPPLREKLKRLKTALDYFLVEKGKFRFFCSCQMLTKGINYKGFIFLLYPKYWPLAPRLILSKLQLIPRKISSIKKAIASKI